MKWQYLKSNLDNTLYRTNGELVQYWNIKIGHWSQSIIPILNLANVANFYPV